MNKAIFLFLVASILAGLIIVPGQARAFGWKFLDNSNLDTWAEKMSTMFENLAQILGISVEKVKNYWAEGKSIKEIMEAENINKEDVQKRIQQRELEQLRERLQKMVEKGIITQEQADKRYQTMQKWMEERGSRFCWIGHCKKRFWFGR